MRILHTYCLNHNIGDYYLGIGVKNLLRKYLEIDLIAETNLQGTVFNEYYIENVVNKKYDLLVIGGGGIIHGAHWPNGWFWLIEERLIKAIRIPFIVYGAGYNYFSNEGGIPEIGRSHLKETINRSAFFSVRNDGSINRLTEQIGIETPEIPDPGFHINLDRKFECQEEGPFVVIQLANDKPEFRFTSTRSQNYFVAEMRKVISSLSKRYKVILAPHVHDDVSLSYQVAESMPNTHVWDFSRYAFDRVTESIGFYEKAQFVLAMRGHGQIIPIAFDTPVISLENHPKHIGLMEKLGIGNYNVPLASENLSEAILDKVAKLESNIYEYKTQLTRINKELLYQTAKAFETIKSRLHSHKYPHINKSIDQPT